MNESRERWMRMGLCDVGRYLHGIRSLDGQKQKESMWYRSLPFQVCIASSGVKRQKTGWQKRRPSTYNRLSHTEKPWGREMVRSFFFDGDRKRKQIMTKIHLQSVEIADIVFNSDLFRLGENIFQEHEGKATFQVYMVDGNWRIRVEIRSFRCIRNIWMLKRL